MKMLLCVSTPANQYPILKKRLEDAIIKKDPVKLEDVLNDIDRKVPIAKIPEQDKPLHENARALLMKLEPPNGTV